MNPMTTKLTGAFVGLLLCATAVTTATAQTPEGRTGTVRQPLVGGTVIDAARQEEFALLSLTDGTGNCSASLLTNGWVITAAHCVELEDASRNPIPDPTRPGQNLLKP